MGRAGVSGCMKRIKETDGAWERDGASCDRLCMISISERIMDCA